MRKFVITGKDEYLMVLEYADRFLTDLHLYDEKNESLLSKIVVGRVKDVVPDINAAFIEIDKDCICYLPLSEKTKPVFCNAKNTDKICQGDLILVQVVKEAIKTKAPTVSTNITLTGKYAVFDREQANTCSISKKIKDRNLSDSLRELGNNYVNDRIGCIIRTQAKDASETDLRKELDALSDELDSIISRSAHLTAFSVLKEAPVCFIKDLLAARITSEDRIITDQPEYVELISRELSVCAELYQDDYPLSKCYSIDEIFEKLRQKTVWLKCGGNLVIEPCEAMTVIDVNTSKAVDKRNSPEDNYFKINMEAAAEIGRQLRLRNISGMILVDFINMKEKEHWDLLIRRLKDVLDEDSVKTMFVDVTGLGLVEITREKRRKAVHELLKRS